MVIYCHRNNYNSMIINESIMLNTPEKFEHRRYSFKKEPDNRSPKHFSNSNTRFFTERANERHFSDYEIGRKIIKDLPELKIDKLKNRNTGYHRNFNHIPLEKVKHREELVTQMEKIKQELALEGEGSDDGFEMRDGKSYTQFINRVRTEGFEQRSRQRGYSMIIPILNKPNIKRNDNSQVFKRKIFKNKRNSSTKIKKAKAESISPQHAISSFIKIQKKQLNQIKVNRELVNRFKFLNYEKNDMKFKRTMHSRIQPWALSHNDIDIF